MYFTKKRSFVIITNVYKNYKYVTKILRHNLSIPTMCRVVKTVKSEIISRAARFSFAFLQLLLFQ